MRHINFYGFSMDNVDFFGNNYPTFISDDMNELTKFINTMVDKEIAIDIDCRSNEDMNNPTGHLYMHGVQDRDALLFVNIALWDDSADEVYISPHNENHFENRWDRYSHRNGFRDVLDTSFEDFPPLILRVIYGHFGETTREWNEKEVQAYKKAKANYPDSPYTIADVYRIPGLINRVKYTFDNNVLI